MTRRLIKINIKEMDLWRNHLGKELGGVLNRAPRPDAVMFSGGFDSLFLYKQAKMVNPKVLALTVAFEHFNRETVEASQRQAKLMSMCHEVVSVSLREYLKAGLRLREFLAAPGKDYDVPLVLAALMKVPKEIKVLWTGMGSDQWFGNESLAPDWSVSRARKWTREALQDHQCIAKESGKRLFFPFLSPALLRIAAELPDELKKNKQLLRSMDPAVPVSATRERELQVPDEVRQLLVRVCDGKEDLSL